MVSQYVAAKVSQIKLIIYTLADVTNVYSRPYGNMGIERMRAFRPSPQYSKKVGSKRIKTVRKGRVVEQKISICGPKIPVINEIVEIRSVPYIESWLVAVINDGVVTLKI
jgi:hypothetical protein